MQKLASISREVEEDLLKVIEALPSKLKYEALGEDEGWYLFDGPFYLTLDYSDEPMQCNAFVPEGTIYKNGYVVPTGGIIYGDHPRNEEQVVQDLSMYEQINLLDELQTILSRTNK